MKIRIMWICLSLMVMLPLAMAGQEVTPLPSETPSTSETPASPESPATDDVDSLFGDGDSIVQAPDVGPVSLSSLTTSVRPLVNGSISLKGGFSLGWSEVPDFSNLGLNFQKAIGYSMTLSGTFDARPDPTLHVFGSVSTSFPAGVVTTVSSNPLGDIYAAIGASTQPVANITWSGINIGEVYVDYTLLNTFFFRVGKSAYTWGQGRILGNPANFVGGAEDGATIKLAVPVLGGTWTAVALARPSYFGNTADISPTNLGLASNWEGSAGPFSFGVAGFAQKAQGNFLSTFVKTNLIGIDLYSETVLDCSPMNWQFTAAPASLSEIAGFFWEGGDPKFQIQGEYLFSGKNPTLTDHSLGIGAAIKAIPGTSIKVGIQWVHTFWDNSGNVVLGMQTPIAPHLSLSVAFPFLYGATGSRYVPSSTTQRIGLAVSLELSSGF